MHIQKQNILAFLLAILVGLSICTSAFAAETDDPAASSPASSEVIEEEEQIIYGSEEDIPADAEIIGVEVYSLSPVTPEDTTGLKSVLLQYIGDYDPVIIEYEYQNNNQYSSYLREVQPDYVWLCSCGLLVVVLYSLMKLGGALLCRK